MPTRTTPRTAALVLLVTAMLAVTPVLSLARQAQPAASAQTELARAQTDEALHPWHEINAAMLRLPLAAVLGAALALRPRPI